MAESNTANKTDSETTPEIKDKSEIAADTTGRVYELGYLLVPTISEEEAPGVYGNIKELMTTLGGAAISDDMPRMIPLAYSMVKVVANIRNKFDHAYFGWVKFTMDPESILELKKKLDLDPNVIRFLILKTVKENTIAAKRFVRADMHKRPAKTEDSKDAAALPMDKEVIDKEIDALIAA